MSRRVAIVCPVRTAVGTFGGALKSSPSGAARPRGKKLADLSVGHRAIGLVGFEVALG
jgi:hypothetical protein